MKTITKFMTLCALFVGVNVSAQTYITSFPHSETFEEGVPTAFVGGSVASGTEIGNVFTANTSTDVGTALFDGDQSTDGAQAITVGETDVFTISYTSYFGWLSNGKEATFSVKNSDGIELISYGYNTKAPNLTTVKICGGNNLLETPIPLQSKYNDSKGANGITGNGSPFRNIEDYNTKVTIVIAKSSASITFVNPSRGVNTTLSASIGSDVKVDLVSINLGNETASEDRGPAIDNMTITKETAQSSTYTLKKVCSGVELSTEELNGFVGNEIVVKEDAFFNSDKTKKYIYVSDDSEGKTIASDGSTVVTVTYREAETYSYSVKSSTDVVLAEGSNFEGESITIPYPMYVNEDGVLYQADADKQQYNHVFTLTTNAQEEVITYNETEIVDVVMLVEAETLLRMTPSAGNNGTATIRSSNAKVAYPAEDVQIITLPAGKYQIVVDIYGGQKAPGELTMTIGEASHTFTSVSQTYHSIQSWDVELTKEESPLMALKGGGNGVAYDFIYIIKTGNVTPISDINADKAVDNDYYDLSGRKVVNPVKGNIYINGGKLIRY